MKFFKKEDLSKVVFVSGPTRSGKIILSRIISSLKKAENIRVDHLTEQLPIMRRLGQISDEACETLLKYSIHFLIYDNYIGRNSNFKTTDFTSIWNTPDPQKYLKRLWSNKKEYGDNSDGDDAIKRIKKEKIIFNMMIHYELMHIDAYLNAFPKCHFYNLIRHPVDLIYSWSKKGYSKKFLLNPRNATLMINYKGNPLPYYAVGIEDKFTKGNITEKLVYMIYNSMNISNKKLNSLDSNKKRKVKNIFFDDLVTNPKKIILKICRELNTEVTSYTHEILQEERCPRVINIEEREKKLSYIEKNISKATIKILEEMINDYEKKNKVNEQRRK